MDQIWLERLSAEPKLSEWVQELKSEMADWYSLDKRGDLGKWMDALKELPEVLDPSFEVSDGLLRFASNSHISADLLKTFHPWRKGPLQIGDQYIDTEWRSDWKWERVENSVDLTGKKVLDIGCGNGYYLWRMLASGAEWVLGIDPYLPYVMQFKAMQHFAGESHRGGILPIGVEKLPRVAPCFDSVFSMGVLYHQKSPLEHLMHCRDLLVRGGELILETIVLPPEAGKNECLVPEGRYAKMKNVYFIPSVEMLCSWLRKLRFKSVEVIDISQTSIDEQRQTEWMTFESLENYLAPNDLDRTIEGHPAPWRVVIKSIFL